MKLFTRYNRVNLAVTLPVLVVASVAYYFILRSVLIGQLDDTLRVEEQEFLDHVEKSGSLPPQSTYRDQSVNYQIAEKEVKRRFRMVHRYDTLHHEMKRYRCLFFPVRVNGNLYTVSVMKSQVEAEDLVALIAGITIGIIILLLFFLFLANRFFLRKLWRPFYATLEEIKLFHLSSKRNLGKHPSSIEEFSALQQTVGLMAEKATQEYDSLKNFADNASHEMQTPLAIINSKLDLLIQDPALASEQVVQVQAMYDAVRRMSRLNQSLLLLAKIENGQFEISGPVDLEELVRKKIYQFTDLAEAKQLHIHTVLEPASVPMNDFLAESMLNNLIANSIRHNQPGGEILLELSPGRLIISNTGPELPFPPGMIFERFRKGNQSEGIGLGLAIVKQVADYYSFSATYAYAHLMHRFTIQWAD